MQDILLEIVECKNDGVFKPEGEWEVAFSHQLFLLSLKENVLRHLLAVLDVQIFTITVGHVRL